MAVEGGSWFVKDDQMKRSLGDRKGACNFDHLAFADRQVANDGVRSDAMAWKDLVEFAADEVAGLPSPAPPGDGRAKNSRILRNGEIGAERKLLDHETD